MKGPTQGACMDIKGADVTRGRGVRLWITTTHDDQILVHNAGRCKCDGLSMKRATKILSKIDTTMISECFDRLSAGSVQCIEEVHDSREHNTVVPAISAVPVAPIRNTATGLGTADTRVKFPKQFSSLRIEFDYSLQRCTDVHRRSDHDGAGLQTVAGFLHIKLPLDL